METRHYVGLLGNMHVMFKLGPGKWSWVDYGPHDPIPLGDGLAYPVSSQIADEWVRDDDDATLSLSDTGPGSREEIIEHVRKVLEQRTVIKDGTESSRLARSIVTSILLDLGYKDDAR